MQKDYWLQKWQTNDIAFHKQEITQELVPYIDRLDLKPGHHKGTKMVIEVAKWKLQA